MILRVVCSILLSVLCTQLWTLTEVQAQSSMRNASSPGASPPVAKGKEPQKERPSGEGSAYVLGPEDGLRVTVEEYPQFSHEDVPVLPNGTIILPVYGTVPASGKSIRQVEADLRARLSRRMRNPRLNVSLVRPRAVYMFVVGAVTQPGKVKISAGYTIADALDAAGGARGRPEDLIASLKRGNQAPIPVNVKMALTQPLSPANLEVRAADTLTVRLVPKHIYVVGAVKSPGKLPIVTNDFRLTDVLAAAGGPEGQLDELQAILTRAGQPPVAVDLNEAVLHPLSPANLLVQANDTLTVRRSPRYVYVVGAVQTVGKQLMATHEYRLTDALMAAGGVVGRLEQMQATLTRVGQAPLTVDLNEAVVKPTSSANILLRTNDTLTVAEQEVPRINVIGDVLKPGIFELYRTPRPNANELPLQARVADAVKAAGGLKYSAEGPVGFAEQKFTGAIVRRGESLALRLEDALEGEDETANIPLQPGDLLSIKVVPPLTVVVDGAVRAPGKLQLPPGAGVLEAVVKANGLTRPADRIAATIWRSGKIIPFNLSRALLSDDPAVNFPLQDSDILQLNEPQSINVQLTGRVTRPQALRLSTNASILDALVQSGGLSDKPEALRITVLRNTTDGSWQNLSVDPVKLLALEAEANLRLQDGDFIEVNPKGQKRTVFVRGEIARQGSYEVEEGEGLDKLILRAGGPTAEAALTKISVRRNDVFQTVDVHAAINEGAKVDFPLQEGDFVIVPKIADRVLVMEAVGRPGSYPVPEKGQLTLFNAIAMAGGLRGDAQKGNVQVLRKTATGVEKRLVSVDILNGGDGGAQEILQPGDIVYVPARNSKPSFLRKVMGTLSSAASAIGVFGLLIP